MRYIMVLNSKGGSGKSTIATSLAAYYAGRDQKVALVDYDRQGSSLEWLQRRPESRPKVTGVAGFDGGLRGVPRNADVVIVDAPAGCHGADLNVLVRHVETVVVPVLPSTIDISASTKFIGAHLQGANLSAAQLGDVRLGPLAPWLAARWNDTVTIYRADTGRLAATLVGHTPGV